MFVDYEYLNKLTEGKKFPISGTNADGTDIIIERGSDYYKVSTIQDNDWIRINYYHEDGTIEETYTR